MNENNNLKIDLSPPKVAFKTLDDGQLFLWNSALWMVYPHLIQSTRGSTEPSLYEAVCISNQDGGGYRCQHFEPDNEVTPCVVEMKVSRIG